jgi:hypothetical protein
MFPGFANQPFDATFGWHNDRINTIFQGKGQLTLFAGDSAEPRGTRRESPSLFIISATFGAKTHGS